jgi:hypothetical protein
MFRPFRRKRWSPLDEPCSICGGLTRCGYSEHAESLENIRPLCLACLQAQMRLDYGRFEGRSVVVQPAVGPPVYVFQPAAEWPAVFAKSQIPGDVASLLAHMNSTYVDCGAASRFRWVESAGLTGDNFGEMLDRGISATLLENNPVPMA